MALITAVTPRSATDAIPSFEDPAAFDAYQIYHANNYGQMCHVTFEPLADLDAAMAPMIAEHKAKS